MDEAATDQVRAFNRTVAERIGALADGYLARGRPLGASRVLWEVGAGVDDARALRSRLRLDSGYLSRLLRVLEGEGLVAVEPDERDRRVRRVRLTAAGRAERGELDRRSDELARSFLEPLGDSRRAELVAAMGVVERLLTAGLVETRIEDPSTPAARFCIEAYFAELDHRFDGGFDPARSSSPDPGEFVEPGGLFLVARLRGEPVGCGALRLRADAAELKRMWVAPSARGLGLGRRLLGELEQLARERGCPVIRLDTNRALVEAISLYRSAGYAEIAAFNDEPHAHHWFEKRLRARGGSTGAAGAARLRRVTTQLT
jgi:DNA-binding MarR family transcriptional regulator/GNAT superfamily N-acetyltransferase